MGAIVETWRGSSAILRWLFGAPLMFLRMILTKKPREHVKKIMMRHSAKALETCRISVEVEGSPPQFGTSCVVCFNETSLADALALSAVILPYVDRAAAADIFAWIPFARLACRKVGIELVPRRNRAGTDLLLAKMVDAVKSGERLAWGGEGRLSGQDGVLRFKVGASLIAIRSGAPLIPIALYGGHQTFPLGSMRARPGTICVRFGTGISTDGLLESDARDLADRAQAVVVKMYDELRAGCVENT